MEQAPGPLLNDPTLVGAPPQKRLTREQFFQGMTVRDMLMALGKTPALPDVVFLQGHNTVETALEVMAKNCILSVPVWAEHPERGYTQVDVQDIAAALFQLHGDSIEAVKDSFFQRPILSVCNLSQGDQMRPVTLDTRIGDVLIAMVNVAHRVIVVDDSRFDSGKLLHVLSQFDILRFLDKYADIFPLDLNTIEAKEVLNTHIVSVESSTRAIEALAKCLKHRYSGVAVIDPPHNAFRGHISVSDLRGLTKKDFADLWLSVTEYLSRHGTSPRPTVWCTQDSLIAHVIKRMADNHAHRVYIAENTGHAVGMISITDLLAHLLSCLFPGD